jgi:predicted RNase H-like HicB family nuclease
MKVQVVIQPEAEGGFSAFVPGFPGCTSCGDTLDETLANIREAFEGVLETMQERDVETGANGADPGRTIIRETIDL